MTNRKNYNSIVFLTTLSVYLGLALIGGTPPVLAQDNLSKTLQFKRDNNFICPNNGLIGDEIGKEINPFEYNLAQRLIELLNTTNVRIEIVRESEPETLTDSFFFKQVEFAPYVNKKGNLEEFDWEDESSEWASAAHAGQVVELHSLFLNPLSDCSQPSTSKFVLNSSNIEINDKWFNSRLTVSKATKQRADQLVESLKHFFQSQTSLTANRTYKEVYKYTEVSSENNQVFIVTRLPRASIDALLAETSAR